MYATLRNKFSLFSTSVLRISKFGLLSNDMSSKQYLFLILFNDNGAQSDLFHWIDI